MFVFVDVDEKAGGARGKTPARGDATALQLHFEVRDTGMGIPKDKQRVIFEAFAQADGSTTRKYEGTGLGLTISSRLVELMHGRLWVESEVGQGSKFHFTARFSERADLSRLSPSLPGVARGARVLVVDDNRTSGGILAELLREWTFTPTVVNGGAAALEAVAGAAAARRPFDLLLIDAAMPDTDGFALAHALQQSGSHAPVVMMLTSAGRRGARGERSRAAHHRLRDQADQDRRSAGDDGSLAGRRASQRRGARAARSRTPSPRCGATRCVFCSRKTT